MIAQHSTVTANSKLFFMLTIANIQKNGGEEKELDCWNHSILKDRNGKLQQKNFTLTFCLTLLEEKTRLPTQNDYTQRKEKDDLVVRLEIIRW